MLLIDQATEKDSWQRLLQKNHCTFIEYAHSRFTRMKIFASQSEIFILETTEEFALRMSEKSDLIRMTIRRSFNFSNAFSF